MKRRTMRKIIGLGIEGKNLLPAAALLAAFLALPQRSWGFDMAGPRSMGMGGAFVAACDDATAVYWNPAAITQIKGVEILPYAGARVTEEKVYDIVRDLEEWDDDHDPPYTLSEMKELKDILERFNQSGVGVFGNASAGFAVATKWFALSSVALGQANLDPYADTELSHLGPTEADRARNRSRVDVNSLVTNNIALTLATTLGIPNLALGANLKYIQAYRYTDRYYVFDQKTGEYADIDYEKRFNDNRVDGWGWGADAGALVILGDYLRLGVLGRNLNEPRIDWEKRQPRTKLRNQFRAGAAIMPFKTLTLSLDADVTEQGREVIETRSGKRFKFDRTREVSAGLEWWLLRRHLALRGGVNNLTDGGSAGRFYTAGLGIRIPYLGFDLAGGYGEKRRYAASVALSVRF